MVTDPAVRAKLLPASYGQFQITDASHLVVFAAKKNFSEADVDAFINHTAVTRGVSVELLPLIARPQLSRLQEVLVN